MVKVNLYNHDFKLYKQIVKLCEPNSIAFFEMMSIQF